MPVVTVEPVDVRAILDRFRKVDILPLLLLLVDSGPVPTEVPLPNHLSMVPGFLQEMGDGGPFGGDEVIAGSVQDATGQTGAPIVASSQHAVPRGRADCAGGMSIHESNSFVRHLLQVGGLDLAMRIGRGDVPDSEIICEHEDDVGILVIISGEKTARDEQRE